MRIINVKYLTSYQDRFVNGKNIFIKLHGGSTSDTDFSYSDNEEWEEEDEDDSKIDIPRKSGNKGDQDYDDKYNE